MTIEWNIFSLVLALFAAHALCDYPLQGDFLARGKNHRMGLIGVPWYQCLLAHCLIHAGAVMLITMSPALGFVEFGIHWLTDYAKCEGKLSFNQDQAIHYGSKVIYAVIVLVAFGR